MKIFQILFKTSFEKIYKSIKYHSSQSFSNNAEMKVMKSKTLHPLLVPPLGRVCVCAHTRVHMFMHLVTQLCPTLATPWTVAPQAPLSMGFPRQEYWSSLPFSSPLYLPNSGIEPAALASPALAGGLFYFYFLIFLGGFF